LPGGRAWRFSGVAMRDPQRKVIAFLRRSESYGAETGAVEVIETHASRVFLAGERAYKLKRAVTYPYLDFSTSERRRAACEAELALNRRTAPQLYLDVRPICRGADGTLGWDKDGEPVDWVVVMRRFDQPALLDRLAQAGRLLPQLVRELADHIAAFHAGAEICRGDGGSAAMAELVQANIQMLRGCRSAGFAAELIDRLEQGLREALARVAALLDERRAGGKVRRCHGDLHLRNICLVDGRPVLFDCVEFSEALARIDVLYDLAFLLMDLDNRGHRDLANLALNRYLDLSAEDDGLAALPLFLSLRAAIRAHVTATAVESSKAAADAPAALAEARRYLDAAVQALGGPPARLVAIGGRSGSGKSTLAARLAPALGREPGARLLRSDVLRKRRFGVAPEAPLPPAAYTPEVTAEVYRELGARAGLALRAGSAAVIDGVALAESERRAFAAVAAAAAVPFTGIWLDAPAAAMQARIAGRRGDASDATHEVLEQQLHCDLGALDWVRIDAGGGADATLAAVRRALGLG
jgi:uncharacterized protein